jgi:aldose 1-epimerase
VLRRPGVPELPTDSAAGHWIVCGTEPDAVCVEPLTGPVNGLHTHHQLVEPGAPAHLTMALELAAPRSERPALT